MSAPEHLYHYTSIGGLLGILKERCIWVTDIRCLNDSSELKPLLVALQAVVGARSATIAQWLLGLLSEPQGFLGVACFSKQADDLSQWRGFTTLGQGVAIRFDGPGLERFAQKQGYQLIECKYEAAGLDAAIKDVLHRSDAEFAAGVPAAADTRKLLWSAASLKDKAFAGEREWRLVSPVYGLLGGRSNPDPPLMAIYERTKYGPSLLFRAGVSTAIPYLHFPHALLDGGEREWSATILPFITGATIGPSREPDLAKWAVEEAFRAHQVRATVTKSVAPYRTP